MTLPLSVTLPVDEPSCSVSDPVPEIAPVTVIVPLLVRMDRELAATARAVAVTFPEPVLILLLPVTLTAAKVAESFVVLKVPFRVVAEAVLVKPPSKVRTSPPLPRMTPPLFSSVTAFVTCVVLPRNATL